MNSLTLVIGNRNYSSWSLRPWMLLRHLGLEFDEVLLPLAAEIARIDEAWTQCRRACSTRGPWLFGADYSVADAMFAPVVLRFQTYGASLSTAAAGYLGNALADPVLREWMSAAQAEPWTLPAEERGL